MSYFKLSSKLSAHLPMSYMYPALSFLIGDKVRYGVDHVLVVDGDDVGAFGPNFSLSIFHNDYK
jgi:hypothetical protein